MAKKEKKKKKATEVWKLYDGNKRKNKTCPKCGPSVFLAEHDNRRSCGKCGYMEKK